jgi:hypothetical protein
MRRRVSTSLRQVGLQHGNLRSDIWRVFFSCGIFLKPSCHCDKHNDPGHDPQFRLTRRVAGKTLTESFPNPTALRKAQQEVAEFSPLPEAQPRFGHPQRKDLPTSPGRAATGRLDRPKKNGYCDPSGGGAGSKPTPVPGLCATTQGRPLRSGGWVHPTKGWGMRRIKSRIFAATSGLPGRRRDFMVQCQTKALRCERRTMSG